MEVLSHQADLAKKLLIICAISIKDQYKWISMIDVDSYGGPDSRETVRSLLSVKQIFPASCFYILHIAYKKGIRISIKE